MPRFYFHIRTINGHSEEDEVGATYATTEDAVNEAQELAKELTLDSAKGGTPARHIVDVADEAGNRIICIDCLAGK
jgi:hypothetical protein